MESTKLEILTRELILGRYYTFTLMVLKNEMNRALGHFCAHIG